MPLRPAGARAAATRADVALYRFIRRDLNTPALDGPLRVLTIAGEHAACWYALGVAGSVVDRGNRPAWRGAMRAILATQLLNTGLKALFRRKRPALADLPALVPVPTSLSFPSAHASTSFCAARSFRPLVRVPLGPVAAAIAFSRVYFGVHYPSDVVVGATLGAVVAGVARR
ncbi:MAG TPA: phosphatase PAP2 family protein [Solirubrobacteraceae bacterium]|nr:phosphatase PAP2 family protein [Solirubrobacteraceae bacterium]